MKNSFIVIIVLLLCVGFISCAKNDDNSLLDDGIKKYKEGDYEGALKIWNELLKIDPDNEKAKKYIGRAEYRLERSKTEK